MDSFTIKTHDIWEDNLTTRREDQTEHIHSLGFQDIREKVTLQRLGCIPNYFISVCYYADLRNIINLIQDFSF